MNIKKTKIQADTELVVQEPALPTNSHTCACGLIEEAINNLGEVVQSNPDDIVAKEAIANLAVVLLDLQCTED